MSGLRVECVEGPVGPEPVRFGTDCAMREVAAIVDRWPGEGYCYFRVQTREGGLFLLRRDADADRWRIAAFESGPAAASGLGRRCGA